MTIKEELNLIEKLWDKIWTTYDKNYIDVNMSFLELYKLYQTTTNKPIKELLKKYVFKYIISSNQICKLRLSGINHEIYHPRHQDYFDDGVYMWDWTDVKRALNRNACTWIYLDSGKEDWWMQFDNQSDSKPLKKFKERFENALKETKKAI